MVWWVRTVALAPLNVLDLGAGLLNLPRDVSGTGRLFKAEDALGFKPLFQCFTFGGLASFDLGQL